MRYFLYFRSCGSHEPEPWKERLPFRSRGEARALRGPRSRYIDGRRPDCGREERRRFGIIYFPFGDWFRLVLGQMKSTFTLPEEVFEEKISDSELSALRILVV